VIYAELAGAHHAFDLFVSARAKPVLESVERFFSAVHEQAQGSGAPVPEADIGAGGVGDEADVVSASR
jgi:hypothetical protein